MPAEVDEYPYTGYPRGWFQIGWSSDFPVGTTVPLYYFGRHLVAYRGESRAVHVFDAHCAHMGAHLGFGGMVEGDCIRCPYHGWKYDQNGQNIEIPDSDRAYPRVRLAGWPVSEQAELVLMWYDAEDRRPLWDPPQVPEFGLPDSYMLSPDLRHIWRNLKMRPQYIVENTVDISHQKWVHHSPSEHELIEWEIDGAMCRTRQTITFGVGKAKTWLTPNGPVAGLLDVECWGVGFNVARFLGTDDAAHVASHTPTDEHHLDERLTVVTRIEPGNEDAPSPLALKRFAFEKKQFEFDVTIWENMRYVARPPWSRSERKIFREFREWVGSFYEPHDPAKSWSARTATPPASARA